MKTLKLLLVTFSLLFPLFTFSQIEWQNTIGGDNHESVGNIIQTPDSGYIISGRTASSLSGDKTESGFGSNDMWIIKLDQSGTIDWQNAIGGSGNDFAHEIRPLADGGYILGGGSSSDTSADKTEFSQGGIDAWVLKLDSAGNILWENTIGGTGANEQVRSLRPTSDGGYILGCISNGGLSGDKTETGYGGFDWWIIKIDSVGNIEWQNTIGGDADDLLEDIEQTSDGGYIAGGSSKSDTTGDKTVPSFGGNDMWVIKLDSAGNVLWEKAYGGSQDDFMRGFSKTPDGGIVVGGGSNSPVSGNKTDSNVGNTDIWILKLDSAGNIEWQNAIGGSWYDECRAVRPIPGGGYWLGCYSHSPISGDKLEASKGQQDYWTIKLDATGDITWSDVIGGSKDDYTQDLWLTFDGAAIMIGRSHSSISGDKTENTINGNFYDFWVVKLSPTPVACFTASADTVECGTTVNFSASCSSHPGANDSIILYEWDLTGNGSFDTTGITTSHAVFGADDWSITLRVTDNNGLKDSITYEVHVFDTAAPVPTAAQLPDIVAECEVTALTAPTAMDSCVGLITGGHNTSLPITTIGTTVVTWYFDDDNNNMSTQTQNVIIIDTTPPVPDNTLLPDIKAQCQVTSLTPPTANDNCEGALVGTNNANLPITAQGTTVVTWTYNDGNGNTTTQTQNVIVDDTIAPIPDSSSLPNIGGTCSITSLTAPTATDSCTGSITGTHNASLPITAQGTTVVTWSYDDGNGNISTQTQNVTLDDEVAPVPDASSLQQIVGVCSVNSLPAPTATDDCAGAVTGTHNVSLPITKQGTTTVTWTYDDGNGNTSTQTQTVLLSDITAPAPDANTLADVIAECAVDSLTPPTATDICAGTVFGTHNAVLPIDSADTTVVIWTFDDGNGNTSTQTQKVIITSLDTSVTKTGITLAANKNGYAYQWLDCDNGFSPISGETNQSFTPTANGNYAVEVRLDNCTDTSSCYNMIVVGRDLSFDSNPILLYPNPTAGITTVKVKDGISVQVFDLHGKLILRQDFHGPQLDFDISAECAGQYILRIETRKQIRHLKLVKY